MSETELKNAYIAWAVVYNIFMLSTAALIYAYRKHPFISKRMVNIVIVITLTATWNGNISLVGLNLWHDYLPFPCWVRNLQELSGGPLYIYGILLRLLILYQLATVEKLKSYAFYKLNWFQIFILRMFRFGANKKGSSHGGSDSYKTNSQQRSFFSSKAQKSSHVPESVSAVPSPRALEDGEAKEGKGAPEVITFSNNISNRVLLINLGIFVLVEMIALAIVYAAWSDHINTPSCIPSQNLIRVVWQFLLIACLPVMLYFIKDIEDDIYLRNEIGISAAVCMFCFACYTYEAYISKSDPTYWTAYGQSIFNLIMYPTIQGVSVLFPVAMAIYKDMTKTDQSGNTIAALTKVLDDPFESLIFKRALMKQFCMENFNYYIKQKELNEFVANAKGNTAGAYSTTVKKMMKDILKEFIQEGSSNELNIPHKLRTDFEASMKTAANPLNLVPITDEVLKMMLLNTYPLYLQMAKESK